MKGINVKVIPHDEQRYETCGDWWYDRNNVWQIRVSRLSDWRYEFLIAFHEILEMAWCHHFGISLESVDQFDIDYEEARVEGDNSEPGDDRRAPYYLGHQAASVAERIAALTLGVVWGDYEAEVNNLSKTK